MGLFPDNYSEEITQKSSGSDKYINGFPVGKTKVRVLAEPIIGQSYWGFVKNEDGTYMMDEKGQRVRKPVRVRKADIINPDNIAPDKFTGMPKVDKNYGGFKVWDYEVDPKTGKAIGEGGIKVMHVTQKDILRQLSEMDSDYYKEENGGHELTEYDVTISRDDSTGIAKYTVTASVVKPLTPEQTEAIASTPVSLEALFATKANPHGTNPFDESVKVDVDTEGVDISPEDSDDLPF